MQKVLIICGPTCVGKTSLSIEIAKKYNGEIINGDSMQIYQEMNIGTAKIKDGEKCGVPHHLFDIKTIKESFSVAEFQTLVREKIDEISSRGKLPIIVGGTGLYLKAALYDYEFTETEKKDYNLESKTTEELYSLLQSIDEKTAATIHPNNRKRIIRAIEVVYESGEGKEDIRSKQQHKPIYNTLFIGLTRPRPILYSMIDERVDIMINEGLEKEVKYILDNASSNSTCLQAIGYKEFIPYFASLKTLDEVIYDIKMNTHKFAKRQYTWFNHQMNTKWIDVQDKTLDSILSECSKLMEEW